MNNIRYFVESENQRAYFRPMARHRAFDVEWEEYQTELRGQALRMSVRMLGDASFDCMLHHAGETALPVHVGAEWSVSFSDESYTLIPGIFYNGNESEEVKTHVVRWGREDLEPLGFALHATASTLCMHRETDGGTWIVQGAPQTRAGWSGWQVNRAAGTISYCAPAIERRRMRHWQWEDEPRPAYRLLPRATLRFTFRMERVHTASIDDLFRLYFDRIWSRPAPGVNHIELVEAGEMIVDHLQKRHWAKDKNGRPVFRNAVFDAEPMLGREVPEWTRKWNVLMGWNSGPGVALPGLGRTDAEREQAVAFLDLIAEEALAPGGLVYPLYDEHTATWRKGDPTEPDEYFHVRVPAEYAEFMYRAWANEAQRGVDRPTWRVAARTVTDSLCGLWEREGDFGYRVDYLGKEPRILQPGSCAGAFVLRALARRMAAEGPEDRIRDVFLAASRHYYQRFVARGHCTGGPLDILKADDCESVSALAAAWTQGAGLLNSEELLAYAKAATHLFSTWVFAWSAPFPPGTALEGRDPCGGVLANVQNRHIGPGICTDSGAWLKGLSRLTGDARYLGLYQQIANAACRFVSRENGDLWGGDPAAYSTFVPFPRGQVTEQINVSDFFHDPGEIWHVSAAWPAMAILLTALEEKQTANK